MIDDPNIFFHPLKIHRIKAPIKAKNIARVRLKFMANIKILNASASGNENATNPIVPSLSIPSSK